MTAQSERTQHCTISAPNTLASGLETQIDSRNICPSGLYVSIFSSKPFFSCRTLGNNGAPSPGWITTKLTGVARGRAITKKKRALTSNGVRENRIAIFFFSNYSFSGELAPSFCEGLSSDGSSSSAGRPWRKESWNRWNWPTDREVSLSNLLLNLETQTTYPKPPRSPPIGTTHQIRAANALLPARDEITPPS